MLNWNEIIQLNQRRASSYKNNNNNKKIPKLIIQINTWKGLFIVIHGLGLLMLYMLVRKFTPSMHKIHDFLFSGEANYNCRYRQQNISSCLMVDRKQGRNVTCLQNYSCLFQTQCLRKGPMSLPLRVGGGPLDAPSLHIRRGRVFFLK